MVPKARPSHHPKRHLDRFSRFRMGPKCYAVQCIVNGEENPQNCHFLRYFVTPPKEDRATAIEATCTNNMVKIARVAREICSRADRQTDTQTCSLQYFFCACDCHPCDAKLARYICYGAVCVCLSVCHISEFYQYAWTDWAGFGHRRYPRLILHWVGMEFDI